MGATPHLLARAGDSPASLFRIDVFPRAGGQMARFALLQGALDPADLIRLSRELLVDPVTEVAALYAIDTDGHILATFEEAAPGVATEGLHTLDVAYLPGVTDTTAESLLRAALQIGIQLEGAATGQRHFFSADLDLAEVERLSRERYNPIIQRCAIDAPIAPSFLHPTPDRTVEIVPLREADDARLLAISAERRLALDLAEMQAVRAYYAAEGREPTDVEIEMIAQTWSEHCIHKTFRALIEYTGPAHGAPPHSDPVSQRIDGLLNTYIRAVTDKLARPFVRSAFVDNAGIIAFDDQFDLAFKVETHNHPSALEPFGGANTGVGGVVRDILGVSARPIANTDVLCFGFPDTPPDRLPAGVLPPARIAEGVIHGIEDYGNKMGIPTVNGAIHYHAGYTANPLVFCGCLGILPRDAHRTQVQGGDLIVVLGGRTGRDGLRGATFSSMEMDTTTSQVAGSAVQIGHAIHEKQAQEAILRLRDAGLYHAITDCGAGGLSSAVSEMAAEIGGVIDLERVPLKYPGLRPWEIWLSEAQERMVIAVAPTDWEAVRAICVGQDVEASVIGTFGTFGKFGNQERLVLRYEGQTVGEIGVHFLHRGIPRRHLKAEWAPPAPSPAPEPLTPGEIRRHLLELLASPTIRSKENVIRRYDHEVQGGTAVKPLGGPLGHAPNDGAVIVPLDTRLAKNAASTPVKGVALAAGLCPDHTEADPYAMAWAAVDEAMRNLIAVGADPDQVAILDNFCWGDPKKPDRLGSLVRCAQGCHDAALAYHVPFISGKDSLNNEYTDLDGSRHAIPGTLLISALGIVPDVTRTVTSDLKTPGDALYLVGAVEKKAALDTLRLLHSTLRDGLVQACHDLSEGGLAVTIAEMCIGGRLGAALEISPDTLFEERLTRFVVEVAPAQVEAFEARLHGVTLTRIGQVTDDSRLRIDTHGIVYLWPLDELDHAWRGHLPPEIPAPPAAQASRISTPRRRAAIARTTPPRALILHANGTNRDRDAALAIQLAGGDPEVVHVNQILAGERRFADYQILIVPGGFSYGDDLGAGVLWALDLRTRFRDDLQAFIAAGRPVMGICNGFQALVKAGVLPGGDGPSARGVTLTYNEWAHFECRWVSLLPNPGSPCLFTEGIETPVACPVAHGEGRIAVIDSAALDRLRRENLIALTYLPDDAPASYPQNPNGSILNIAGLTNAAGNVLGLMPHPENHVFPWQNPHRQGEIGGDGLRLFQNAVKYA